MKGAESPRAPPALPPPQNVPTGPGRGAGAMNTLVATGSA